ncbi:MAG: carboxypeptidase-like regulatory domain-containing protein [Ferruginibacter sp.]
MLRNICCLFVLWILCCCYFPCAAQISFSGKVVNDETGLPIAGASVYFNNTSTGTISNTSGEFSFRAIKLVNTELIVSSIGYGILAFKPDAATGNGKYFVCRLKVKTEALKEVLVLTDSHRKKWLDIFKRNFLGITEEASESNIVNENDIYFSRGKDEYSFNAYSDTPLVILNRMLGYKVSFQLIEFAYNEQNGSTYFYGYTRYEELGSKKRWTRNRCDAYLGSTLHFFRALISDQLQEEGFDIYLLKNVQLERGQSPMSIAARTSAAQIVSPDSAKLNSHRIHPGARLMVEYKKEPSTKYYLRRKVMVQGYIPVGFRAFIAPFSDFFTIDENGILGAPLSVEFSGYWIYEKAANLLPYNYRP